MTLGLAAASRARGLFRIAAIIAASWACGMGVYALERTAGADYAFAYPLIDAFAAMALIAVAPTKRREGHDLVVFIVIALAIQALVRLGLTPALPGLLMFIVNRLFDAILLSIWLMAAAIILRRRNPQVWADLSAPLRRRGERKAQQKTAAEAMPRWLHNLLAAIHNDDRPEGEHIPMEERPAAPPKGAQPAKARRDS